MKNVKLIKLAVVAAALSATTAFAAVGPGNTSSSSNDVVTAATSFRVKIGVSGTPKIFEIGDLMRTNAKPGNIDIMTNAAPSVAKGFEDPIMYELEISGHDGYKEIAAFEGLPRAGLALVNEQGQTGAVLSHLVMNSVTYTQGSSEIGWKAAGNNGCNVYPSATLVSGAANAYGTADDVTKQLDITEGTTDTDALVIEFNQDSACKFHLVGEGLNELATNNVAVDTGQDNVTEGTQTDEGVQGVISVARGAKTETYATEVDVNIRSL